MEATEEAKVQEAVEGPPPDGAVAADAETPAVSEEPQPTSGEEAPEEDEKAAAAAPASEGEPFGETPAGEEAAEGATEEQPPPPPSEGAVAGEEPLQEEEAKEKGAEDVEGGGEEAPAEDEAGAPEAGAPAEGETGAPAEDEAEAPAEGEEAEVAASPEEEAGAPPEVEEGETKAEEAPSTLARPVLPTSLTFALGEREEPSPLQVGVPLGRRLSQSLRELDRDRHSRLSLELGLSLDGDQPDEQETEAEIEARRIEEQRQRLELVEQYRQLLSERGRLRRYNLKLQCKLAELLNKTKGKERPRAELEQHISDKEQRYSRYLAMLQDLRSQQEAEMAWYQKQLTSLRNSCDEKLAKVDSQWKTYQAVKKEVAVFTMGRRLGGKQAAIKQVEQIQSKELSKEKEVTEVRLIRQLFKSYLDILKLLLAYCFVHRKHCSHLQSRLVYCFGFLLCSEFPTVVDPLQTRNHKQVFLHPGMDIHPYPC